MWSWDVIFILFSEKNTRNKVFFSHINFFISKDNDRPCIPFEYGDTSYAANECRYDYHRKELWCATSLSNDGITVDSWKICDIENGLHTTDQRSKNSCF
jgi:hypothetical protein